MREEASRVWYKVMTCQVYKKFSFFSRDQSAFMDVIQGSLSAPPKKFMEKVKH